MGYILRFLFFKQINANVNKAQIILPTSINNANRRYCSSYSLNRSRVCKTDSVNQSNQLPVIYQYVIPHPNYVCRRSVSLLANSQWYCFTSLDYDAGNIISILCINQTRAVANIYAVSLLTFKFRENE